MHIVYQIDVFRIYEIYTYTYRYCEEYTMHIPAQS